MRGPGGPAAAHVVAVLAQDVRIAAVPTLPLTALKPEGHGAAILAAVDLTAVAPSAQEEQRGALAAARLAQALLLADVRGLAAHRPRKLQCAPWRCEMSGRKTKADRRRRQEANARERARKQEELAKHVERLACSAGVADDCDERCQTQL